MVPLSYAYSAVTHLAIFLPLLRVHVVTRFQLQVSDQPSGLRAVKSLSYEVGVGMLDIRRRSDVETKLDARGRLRCLGVPHADW